MTHPAIRRQNPIPRLRPAPLVLALHWAMAGAVAWGGSAAAHAQAVESARRYDIPAGPLGVVMSRFAGTSGVLLAGSSELVQGRDSPGLAGSYTPQAAIEALLAGTGLEAVRQPNGTYALRQMASAAPRPVPGAAAATLPTVRVEAQAQRETAEGPVPGYVARRSATATKTDTPRIESPQSVTVVGAEQMETLKPQSITEALGYAAGVLRSEDIDATRDQMRVRGFDLDAEYGSYFRDGLKYTVNGYNGQQEPYGLERIELLRGASSVLYGLSAPGGLVNTVSKRPTTDTLRELNVSAGSFGRKQVAGDFGGALTDDGAWSYRLTGLLRDSDTFIDHIPDDRAYLAPALQWRPDAATSWTLLSEYQHDRSIYNPGLPQSGTLLPNVNGKLPVHRFLGDPGLDKYDNTRYSVGYLFEHAFDDALKLRNSLRYFHSKNDYAATSIGLDLDETERFPLYRDAQRRHDASSSITTDTSLQYQWRHGSVEHTALMGFDFTRTRHQSERYDATADTIDIFAPVYGAPQGEFVYQDYSWKSRSRRLGVYVQDQIKLDGRWVLTLGGRQDWVRDRQCAFADPSDCAVDGEKSKAFTGRAGLVYLALNGVAPFVSFSQSWEPTTGVDRDGRRFKPTTGEQYEIGVRYQPPGADTMLSASVYQLNRKNVLVDDPVNEAAGDYFQIQRGEVRARGLELEATTRVGRNAQLIAAYAYTDARTLKSSPLTPELDGQRTGGVPHHQLSVWGDYTFGAFGLPGWKAGIGARYVGATTGTWTDLVTPAYTVVDAMVSYAEGPWRWALNISNLADREYVALCPYRCFYGEPRKVTATATYRW